MKYRKRPVDVEAFQYDGDFTNQKGQAYVPHWVIKAHKVDTLFFEGQGELYIDTLEGKMHVSVGDWIIRGVQGELYPCKPDIFEQTYEPLGIDDDESSPTYGQVILGGQGIAPCEPEEGNRLEKIYLSASVQDSAEGGEQ